MGVVDCCACCRVTRVDSAPAGEAVEGAKGVDEDAAVDSSVSSPLPQDHMWERERNVWQQLFVPVRKTV